MWGDIAIAFILAFVVTFVTTPYMIKIAKKVGAVDIPKDERRVNKKPMPRLRRDSSYLWIYSIYNILVNCNEFRRLNKYI